MTKPLAVLISDVHYNLNTLEVADKAVRFAVIKANELNVPLIVAGDMHDTKANLRAECLKAMRKTLELCDSGVVLMRGNHDSLNEKSEESALDCLADVAMIVNTPLSTIYNIWLLPYFADINVCKAALRRLPTTSIVIMHQGILGSDSGEYMQDSTALNHEDVAGLRVISGHYHRRQTIQLPEGGVWDYLGNPYTLNFGEVDHPDKGYHILMSDGSLEFVPLMLRRHRIIDIKLADLILIDDPVINKDDILWVKITGPSDKLSLYSKAEIASILRIEQDFKLDLISTDVETEKSIVTIGLSQHDILKSIIDGASNVDDDRKQRLHNLWMELVK